MTQLTEHFSVSEMKCRCCGRCEMQPEFMAKLEHYRLDCDIPLPISSGFRCDTHNAKVGGTQNSWHLKGRAADIVWTHLTGRQKYILLQVAMQHGFRGIGISEDFLHLDNRDNYAMWTYS